MKSEKPLIKRFVPLLIILAVVVAMVAIAAPAIAYYIRTAGEVGGEYTPAESGNPSFYLDDETKKMENVRIQVEDKGYPVFVRVAIIVTWQKPGECANPTECDCSECTKCIETTESTGSMECPKCNPDIYCVQPVEGADKDYTIDLNVNDEPNAENWAEAGRYYYFKKPVASGGKTGVLIKSCVLKGNAPEGYVLNVEVIVQTIQAVGSTDTDNTPAWQDAWGISTEDKN